MEEEDKEFFVLVLGVLAAIILVISWWFTTGGVAVATSQTATSLASADDDHSSEADETHEDLPGADDDLPGTDDDDDDAAADQPQAADAEAATDTESTSDATTATDDPAPLSTAPSVFDAIAADPDLSVVTELLRSEGLDQALAEGDSFTVFAPSNDAVNNAASSDTTVALIEGAANSVLTYHVVPGSYGLDELTDIARGARTTNLTTVQGEPLTLTLEGENIVINGTAVVGAETIVTDNGLVHTVNDVLVPPIAALNTLVEQEPILFASGSADIESASFATLDRFTEVLAPSTTNVSIEGHTDSSGDAILNQNLSQSRARSVLNYLVANGVDESRLSAAGFGSSQPVADNETEEGRALNRRIEFKLG